MSRPHRFRRIFFRLIATVALAYIALSAGLFWAMTRPPDQFGRVMSHTPFPLMMVLPFEPLWMRARAGALRPGDSAPDFRLPTLDGKQLVQLSSLRGSRPVVLIFGSYT